VVLVDDGSEESQHNQLTRALRDNKLLGRIEFISTKNNGSASARNLALTKVETEFFCFLDSDDTIEIDNLNKMYKTIEKHKIDIAIANYRDQFHVLSKGMPLTLDREEIVSVDCLKSIYEGLGFWRMIYSTKFINENNIKFLPTHRQLKTHEKYYLDDVFWLIQVAADAKCIFVSKNEFSFYVYRRQESNAQSRHNFRLMEKQIAKATEIYLDYRRLSRPEFVMKKGEKKMLERNLVKQFHDLTPKSQRLILLPVLRIEFKIWGLGGLINVLSTSLSLCEKVLCDHVVLARNVTIRQISNFLSG
jgi:glycosyltransferase involved in cell wall biosynthesis